MYLGDVPPQSSLPIERQALEKWPAGGCRPHKEVFSPQPPGERQRKEKKVDSTISKPPPAPRRGPKTFVSTVSTTCAPLGLQISGGAGRRRRRPLQGVLSIEAPNTSFSLLDRARPVFSFPSGKEKRKWGGAMNQPSLVASPPRPSGRVPSPLTGRKRPPTAFGIDSRGKTG